MSPAPNDRAANSPQLARAPAPTTTREDELPAAIELQRETGLFRGIFVASDKIAKRHRKPEVLIGAERIHSQRHLKPDDDRRKTKRIQSRI
jgi:hypothetical protein